MRRASQGRWSGEQRRGGRTSALPGSWGDCEARLSLPSLSRLGLILLLLQYSTEVLFHLARLFYFADENNEKL